MLKNFNCCLGKGVLKHAGVKPMHKKKRKSDEVSCRSVSILTNLPKIYEKLMYQQLYEHFNSILSPKQSGFRKGHSVRLCLMVILEKFNISRDKGEEFGTFFTFLYKAFDCIDHRLLIIKLSWYFLFKQPDTRIGFISHSRKSDTVSHKVRCLGRYCLILILLIFFLNQKISP